MNHSQSATNPSCFNNSLRALGALVLAATLSWTGLVQAEVKPPGTVLPWMCAEARENNPRMGGWAINQVCMASIVDQASIGQGVKQFVVVHESRVAAGSFFRRQMVYEITQERTRKLRKSEVRDLELLHIGSVSSQGLFQSKMTADYVVGKLRIQTSTRTGRTTARGEIDQRPFRTGEFEHIYHTMSVAHDVCGFASVSCPL